MVWMWLVWTTRTGTSKAIITRKIRMSRGIRRSRSITDSSGGYAVTGDEVDGERSGERDVPRALAAEAALLDDLVERRRVVDVEVPVEPGEPATEAIGAVLGGEAHQQ